jgi:ABC-2 type transport system permease protein
MTPTLAKVFQIAGTNLVRTIRDRSGLFFVFVLPIVIVVALGIQFSGSSQARLGVVAPADDPVAAAILDDLRAGAVRMEIREVVDEETLRTSVERGLLEVGLVLPQGLQEVLADGDSAQVLYLGTPRSLTLGLRPSVETAVGRVSAAYVAARSTERVGIAAVADALPIAHEGFAAMPGVDVSLVPVGERGLFAGFGQFTLGAQTQLVLFMFLTSLTAAAQLVLSKRLGISRRMAATPTSIGTILAGEALGRFGVAMLQGLFILLVTAIVFGVDWGDPLGAGAIVIAFGVVGAGAAMLVGAISTNVEQAGSIGVFAGLGLGAVGGAMVPPEFMPDVMRTVAQLTPHSWALSGLRSLVSEGAGLVAVLPQVGVLLLYGAVLLTLATWRFRRALVS